MPFHGRFVDAIKDGTKDVTRRFTPRHIGTHLRAKVPNGKPRPSQWPGFADLVVTDCHSEMLQNIERPYRLTGGAGMRAHLELELRREGCSSLEEFIEFWDMVHPNPDRQWDANPRVWRIEFRNEDLGQRVL